MFALLVEDLREDRLRAEQESAGHVEPNDDEQEVEETPASIAPNAPDAATVASTNCGHQDADTALTILRDLLDTVRTVELLFQNAFQNCRCTWQ